MTVLGRCRGLWVLRSATCLHPRTIASLVHSWRFSAESSVCSGNVRICQVGLHGSWLGVQGYWV